MATIQPIPRTGLGTLYLRVNVFYTGGGEYSDLYLLDQTDSTNSVPRPPMIQAPEIRLAVKGGMVNTVICELIRSADVISSVSNAIDVSWEVLQR